MGWTSGKRWIRIDRSIRNHLSAHRPETTIILLGSLIVVAMTISSALSIICSREQVIGHTEAELQTIGKVLAAQTQREFEAVELAQTSIDDSVSVAMSLSKEGFAATARSKPIFDMLVQKKEALPTVDAFLAFSLEGTLLNMTRSWPAPAIMSADRDFIRAFQTDPARQVYVSEPLKSRASGEWDVFIARRMTSIGKTETSKPETGKPETGLVVAAIRLSHFEDFYGSLGLPADATVSLFRRDGTMLARFPHAEPAIGGSTARQHHLFSAVLAKSDSGLSRQVSTIDGKERIIAGQILGRVPVVVTVTRSLEAVLAPWKRDAIQLGTATLITDLIAVLAGFLGLCLIRRANRLARFDAVTGIPNRVIFHEAMAAAFRNRTQRRFALLVLDLDQFKDVNDSLGHQAGDRLLFEAGRRIRGMLDSAHVLTRLGGDEFAIVLTTITDQDDAERVARDVIAAFAMPFDIGGRLLTVGISIGAALVPESGGDADGLYRDADLALYRAKTEQRGTYRLFAPEMAAQRSARKALTRDLKTAIETGGLALVFQPLFDLRTRAICGLEALARWTHAVEGVIEPRHFIPLAEDSALIGPLGRWVLRQACFEAARWPQDVTIAVNVSAVQFKVSDVFLEVRDALAASGLDPARLELEITETVQIVEDEEIGSTLRRLKALGVRIALDDFGTGYSSMSYLRSFPFDKIKIDMSFVATMLQSEGSRAIVETILALAQKLGMATTAEGVETAEQLAVLRDLRCTQVQGYFISVPVAAGDVLSLLPRVEEKRALVA